MKIILHKKDLNFNDDYNAIYNEFNIFYQIEEGKLGLNIFEQNNSNLDRYSDIKPYKYTINFIFFHYIKLKSL